MHNNIFYFIKTTYKYVDCKQLDQILQDQFTPNSQVYNIHMMHTLLLGG